MKNQDWNAFSDEKVYFDYLKCIEAEDVVFKPHQKSWYCSNLQILKLVRP